MMEDCHEEDMKTRPYQQASDCGEMRSRGLDYSPRLRSGADTRISGGVVDNRVSGKEKRRRVHAWLGAQIRSETESLGIESTESQCKTPTAQFKQHLFPGSMSMPAPNQQTTKKNVELTTPVYGKSDDYHPLPSESKFISGNSISGPTSRHGTTSPTLGISAYVEKYTSGASITPSGPMINGSCQATTRTNPAQPVYSYGIDMAGTLSTNTKPYDTHATVGKDYGSFDVGGGGDNYCYVYDPAIAKAYTKKYPISPSINTPPPSDRQYKAQGDSRPKRFSASENFTPYPGDLTSGPVSHGLRQERLNAAAPHRSYDVSGPGSFSHDPQFSLPTKYEEYDMRPIKPLDADVKKSLYGETIQAEQKPEEKKHPFLRRSHSTTVPPPTSKHPARSKSLQTKDKQSPATKPTARILSVVENQRRGINRNHVSSYPGNISPRRKRQQHHIADKAKKSVDDKVKKTRKFTDETTTCNEEESIESPQLASPVLDIPVDLKHVRAVTKIQAAWKGYRTRKLDPKVVEIRQEVRARRAEQYISLLCHEVQSLRENLDTENKMRDLQTEAIRYIWSQLRSLQKQKCEHCNASKSESNNKRKRSPDSKHSRSHSKSPRRGKTRGSRKSSSLPSSPHRSPRGAMSASPSRNVGDKHSDSSGVDFEIETESVESYTAQKKEADVSWKEVVDEDIFSGRKLEMSGQTNAAAVKPSDHARNPVMEDTDEGRGTLVTDGEGNPALSSAEDTDFARKPQHAKQGSKAAAENVQLKQTISALQEQVAQLQEAMLNLSDRILSRSFNGNFHDAWEDTEDLRLAPETQVLSLPISAAASPPGEKENNNIEVPPNYEPDEIVSARGEVPRISLKNALTTLHSPLSEDELWAICEQSCQNIKNRRIPSKYIALETTYLRKDGRVEFADNAPTNQEIDEMYLAPEVLDNKTVTNVKASIFSLSVVLWSSADWEMSADQAPHLSQELESLLVVMSQDDSELRAEVVDVIKICEDYHAKAGVNSLRVCSSVFAEVKEAWVLNSRAKKDHKKMALEVSREQEIETKEIFRDKVVPDIKAYRLRSSLKPASQRVLSPCPYQDQTPHERLMESLTSSKPSLRRSPRPKVFSVRDMFQKDPELVQKLNILPGQRRKNQKAMRLVMRRQTPRDPASAPISGVPTAPTALRAEVSDRSATPQNNLSSVVLRWHPAKVYDKHGEEADPEKIIGYRIYVNGHPKGMVAGTKSRALLEGLRFSTEYRVHVRAISALGESDSSNTVIAHITQSPHRRNKEEKGQPDAQAQSIEDKENYLSKTNEPKARPRKAISGSAPQAKPRLGAVFPKQSMVECASIAMSQDRPPGGEDEEPTVLQRDAADDSAEPKEKKGDDIIDRVLRRYGIQQAVAIVPGYSSGSTLSPVPVGYRPKSSVSPNRQKCGTQTSLLDDVPQSSEGSSISSKSSTASGTIPCENRTGDCEVDNGEVAKLSEKSCATLRQSEITPKSLELLAQLKNELLN